MEASAGRRPGLGRVGGAAGARARAVASGLGGRALTLLSSLGRSGRTAAGREQEPAPSGSPSHAGPSAWCCPGAGRVRTSSPLALAGPAPARVPPCAAAARSSLIKEGGLASSPVGWTQRESRVSLKSNENRRATPQGFFLFWRKLCSRSHVRTRVTRGVTLSPRRFPVTAAHPSRRVTECVPEKRFSSRCRGQRVPTRIGRVCGSLCRHRPLRRSHVWGSAGQGVSCGFCVWGHVPSAVSHPWSGHSGGVTAAPVGRVSGPRSRRSGAPGPTSVPCP